jgi:multicomponent Na+:H+ antiporter subunit A
MRSVILETGTRAVFHTILLFSAFLLFTGHNAPGGGFIGGLVAAAALVLRYVAHGPEDVRRTTRVAPEKVLGAGLIAAVGTGMTPWLLGGQLLESGYVDIGLGLLGTAKVTSVLFFDIGVYLVVVGLVLAVLRTLGGEIDK